MKRRLVLILFTLIGLTSYSQNQKSKEMLAEIEGKWELDDNGNVTLVRIIEAPGMSKDEIYTRVHNYFTYNYASENQ